MTFQSIWASASGTLGMTDALLCTACSLILGLLIAFVYMYSGSYSKNFVISLALLPVLVELVIIMVNGNLGTSVAILGAFGLVRFRSIPGSSKEIISVFFAMSIGLATGMGHLTFAIFCTVVIAIVFIVLSKSPFGEGESKDRDLKITIPENLEYADVFDDIFEKYTKKVRLHSVKTVNLGSMFELRYVITMKDLKEEKKMIDEIRCRNGNLTIMCGRQATQKDVL